MSGIFLENDKFKEECGVFGIYSKKDIDVAPSVYYGLYALQHRGQESAGITVSDGEKLKCVKDMGLVHEALDKETVTSLRGNMAIGHVRYSTTGSSNVKNAQPLLSKYKLGAISIAHNGNLINADVIRDLLEDGGVLFHTSNDSEVILNLIARKVKYGIEEAVVSAIRAVKGSYAIVILTENKLIGVRDPHGIRPLCIGKIDDDYILSSESCALDAIGADLVRDVNPGEMVIIDENGIKSIKYAEKIKHATCSFEYIYFARPDSVMDGDSVYESRVRAGELLYKEAPVEADIVVGVPDSGLSAAIGYSKASGIPYGIGLIKNKYVARTFIAPTQELREKAVSVKLNALKPNIEGKRVVIIDDSIVRGTTSRRLVEILRRAGAKEIHFRVSSPIVKYPCYFGIDISYRKELIGAHKNVEEIRDYLGADSLGYLSREGLKETIPCNKGLCMGCFNGVYPESAPIENSKECLER
ncbi:amidophosphoribosyltransferase [Clostridium sediminicola]|uniref:amidophosphoribosyltransferase n=1 Tax=Clostridium sediminicola TaxID=3114879 RepID=UPI0031F1D5DE